MDLLRLAAKIELDDSSYNKGISNAERAAQQLQGKMSAMTVAAGNLIADAVRKGIGAVQNIVGGAVDSYANYEQLVGGVDTLFGRSSKKVQQYAKESFKTTGLSANEYMETVTSFSASLLQGLNGDTEQAAFLADMAITDMADNANKMGTDISAIQSAYQGFAKQNYTMLDNLKLGYGGTQGEMVRLINDSKILDHEIKNLDGITFDQMVEAIHKIQDEMGITGTTAKEAASTISGSKASLAAAWTDLLSAVGGEGGEDRLAQALSNFESAFTTYTENFIPSLVTSIGNSGELAKAVGDAVSNLPTDLLSQVTAAGLKAGTGVIQGATEITTWLIDSVAGAFRSVSADPSGVENFASAIGEFIGSSVKHIVENLPTFVTGLLDIGKALAEGLIDGLVEGLGGMDDEVDKITNGLQENLIDIERRTSQSSGLLSYMQGLIDKYGEGVRKTVEWKEAQKQLEEVMPEAQTMFNNYGTHIQDAVTNLKALNQELRNTAIINALQSALEDEYVLSAEQALEKNKQQARLDRSQAILDSTRGDVVSKIREEAAAKAAEIDEMGGPVGAGQTDYYNKLTSLANGFSHVGDRMTELSELNFDELKDALNFLDSTAFSDEELEGRRQTYAAAQAEVDAAQKDLDAAQAQLDATKQAITDTEAAMDQTMHELLGSGSNAASSITTSGNNVSSALDSVAEGIHSAAMSISGGSYMPEATGMDFVPYDGFKASLHRGERIVTAAENKKGFGGTVDISGLEDLLVNAIRAGMESANVNAVVTDRQVAKSANRFNGNEMDSRRFIP